MVKTITRQEFTATDSTSDDDKVANLSVEEEPAFVEVDGISDLYRRSSLGYLTVLALYPAEFDGFVQREVRYPGVLHQKVF